VNNKSLAYQYSSKALRWDIANKNNKGKQSVINWWQKEQGKSISLWHITSIKIVNPSNPHLGWTYSNQTKLEDVTLGDLFVPVNTPVSLAIVNYSEKTGNQVYIQAHSIDFNDDEIIVWTLNSPQDVYIFIES